MTNQPAPDARSSSLHRRLTVALAGAADRERLTEALVSAPSDGGLFGTTGPTRRLRSGDLWQAADVFAQERAADRRALRTRLDAVSARAMHDCDTARHQLDHLTGTARTLREGARWAASLDAEMTEHVATVEAARDALDRRRAEQRACQQSLDRVLEQRGAAAGAIEEADRELSDLAGSGMDESGLRRELEAAGQAVQEAQEAHARAQARLEELQLEATGLQVRRETSPLGTIGQASIRLDPAEVAKVVAVRDALSALQVVMIDGEVDPRATALAEAWADLSADLEVIGGLADGPSEAELDQARRRAAAAAARLAELDAAVTASTINPDQRAALDAAHATVLATEEQVGRRRGASGVRKRLEAARAAERAMLDELGFGGYLDVVLTGGRSAAAAPDRAVVEREHFEATLALEALERGALTSPELAHLRSERARLLGHVIELLGVDPGDRVLPLLHGHRPMAKSIQRRLADGLAAVGVQPVGISLEEAALAFLEANPLPEADEAAAPAEQERSIELAAIEARAVAVEGELSRASAEVDRTAEALQMAERSVGAFESELSVRAGEDLQRMKRFAAAEQLRAQIDAVAATLRRAEDDARVALEEADQAVASSESSFEQAAAAVSELARQARKLAEELPIDQRPTGDPLHGLDQLAERLAAHAEVLQPEIDSAEAAVASASGELDEAMAACRLASTGEEGPEAEDLAAGLQQLLEADGGTSLVILDEPFAGMEPRVRTELLEVVQMASATRPLALLTDDTEVLGWAIELPADEAAAMPGEALLARLDRVAQDRSPSAAGASSSDRVDITSPDPHAEPAPTARRWAGQR